MGEALSTGDFSQIKGVDPKEMKKLMATASQGLMAKAKGSLLDGLKTGELAKLCDGFDAATLRKQNPDLAAVFDACGADGTDLGTLTLHQMRNALRKMCPKVSGKQIAALHKAMDENKDGVVDFGEFVKMVRAIQSGDVSSFKGVDAAAFQEAFQSSQSLRQKAKTNLLEGLRSGELAKLTEDPLSPTTRQKTKDENPEWTRIFEGFDADRSGVLSFKEVKVALCRVCKDASAKQIETLYRAMDEDGDGNIDLKEFCNMAKALETGDLSRYPKVDAAAFQKMVEEKQELRRKVTESLKDGLSKGSFMTLMEQWDTDQAALRAGNPEWTKVFDNLDAKEATTLSYKDGMKGVRRVMTAEKLPEVTHKQLKALYDGGSRVQAGRLDIQDFVTILEAIKTGDLSKFPKLDPEAYKKLGIPAKSTQEKARGSLKQGLKSGEVAALLDGPDGVRAQEGGDAEKAAAAAAE